MEVRATSWETLTRELFTTSNFVKALQMMECTEKFITNYDTQLLKADIYYYMNEYDNTIESYKTASNMYPVKFAPLEGLLNCYNKQRNYIFERHLAKIILSKDIKVYSDEVERIRNKAYLVLQENINCILVFLILLFIVSLVGRSQVVN